MSNRPLKLLLTGAPGVGKTTLVRQLVCELQVAGRAVDGFVTREVRERDRRVGFVAEAIGTGSTAVIAHVDFPTGPRVGRYRVDVPAFERIAIPALKCVPAPFGIVVIDEIGLMELLSDDFVRTVRHILDQNTTLVATIHARTHPVTDNFKSRDDVKLFEITSDNRDEILKCLCNRLIRASEQPPS